MQCSTLLQLCAESEEDADTEGMKADLSKRIVAQVICVYISAGRFIFYHSGYHINPIDNSFQMCARVPRGAGAASAGLMERLRTELTSVPLAVFLFSRGEQPFHHSDSGRESALPD